jgi:hypothetical protein
MSSFLISKVSHLFPVFFLHQKIYSNNLFKTKNYFKNKFSIFVGVLVYIKFFIFIGILVYFLWEHFLFFILEFNT